MDILLVADKPKMSNKNQLTRIISFVICFLLLFEQSGFAQIAGELDISLRLASLHQGLIQEKFRPLHLRYLSYDPQGNTFNLLLDKGDFRPSSLRGSEATEAIPKDRLLRQNAAGNDIEDETKKLLNYFFVGVSLPNESFWVNLRPDSPDSIIDPELAKTDIGKVLLEADLQLKKDTANYTNPQTLEGKQYWTKLYQKAEELFGYEAVTIPTLTRPWIVPGEIIIRETQDNAYIYKATLKVMLEQDYLANGQWQIANGKSINNTDYSFKDARLKALNEYSSQLIRELIIPKITKEVNTSKKYAPLRQVYYSLILAQWFKQKYYGRGGLYSWLINKKNLNGLTAKTPYSKDTYFKAYQESFNKGEYNIKEPQSTPFGQTIRSYFSGGISVGPEVAAAMAQGAVETAKLVLNPALTHKPGIESMTAQGGRDTSSFAAGAITRQPASKGGPSVAATPPAAAPAGAADSEPPLGAGGGSTGDDKVMLLGELKNNPRLAPPNDPQRGYQAEALFRVLFDAHGVAHHPAALEVLRQFNQEEREFLLRTAANTLQGEGDVSKQLQQAFEEADRTALVAAPVSSGSQNDNRKGLPATETLADRPNSNRTTIGNSAAAIGVLIKNYRDALSPYLIINPQDTSKLNDVWRKERERVALLAYRVFLDGLLSVFGWRDKNMIFVYPFSGPDSIPASLMKTFIINWDYGDNYVGAKNLREASRGTISEESIFANIINKDSYLDALEEESYEFLDKTGRSNCILILKGIREYTKSLTRGQSTSLLRYIFAHLQEGDIILALCKEDIIFLQEMGLADGRYAIDLFEKKLYLHLGLAEGYAYLFLFVPDSIMVLEKRGGRITESTIQYKEAAASTAASAAAAVSGPLRGAGGETTETAKVSPAAAP
ncbi:MAG: hypothetical protein NTU54_03910, partial [Candidatus Omnitrophica bacterium]|nr:hypothetical protein [Candidatus Omnitrophota bacterium]